MGYGLIANAQVVGETLNRLPVPPYIESANRYIPTHYTLCSCVVFARQFSGRSIYGNAHELLPTHTTNPVVGDWVLFRNHTSVIVDIQNDSLFVIESNFIPCSISKRVIKIDSKEIRGYL